MASSTSTQHAAGIVEEIERRFQILITLSLFFPVLLYNLGRAAGQPDQNATLLFLQVATLIGCSLIDYVIFQGCKNTLTVKSLGRLNAGLLWAIAIFIVPIIGFGAGTFKSLPEWLALFAEWISGVAAFGILTVPVVIELFLVIASIVSDRRKRHRS